MSIFARHLDDARFHSLQARRSLERARDTALTEVQHDAAVQGIVVAERLRVWAGRLSRTTTRRNRSSK